jgi:hypothetical protein
VVDDVVAQAGVEHPLAEGQAGAHRDALAKRAGGGLDAGRVAVLGVAGGGRAELAEVLEVLEREAVPGEVEHRVEEHRGVAGAEHEAVAVRPVGVLGRVAHHARVEHVGDRGERHRRAGVAGVRLLHRIHGQRADRVHAQRLEVGRGGGGGAGVGHESVAS